MPCISAENYNFIRFLNYTNSHYVRNGMLTCHKTDGRFTKLGKIFAMCLARGMQINNLDTYVCRDLTMYINHVIIIP